MITVHRVAFSGEEFVVISDQYLWFVFAFTLRGEFLRALTYKGQFECPGGIYVAGTGEMLVCDQKTDAIHAIHEPQTSSLVLQVEKPKSCVVDKANRVIVLTDGPFGTVCWYSTEGDLLYSTETCTPCQDLCLDEQDMVYVLTETHVLKYDSSGCATGAFPFKGGYQIAYHQGNLLITMPTCHSIRVVSLSGKTRKSFAPPDTVGDFVPKAVCVGSSGSVVVCESDKAWMHVFDAKLTHITSWGGKGFGPGQLMEPVSMSVAPRLHCLEINDQ